MKDTAPDLTPAEIFTTACRHLHITTATAPAIFGICRQTFSNWRTGKTKIPLSAFIRIVQAENDLADKLAEQAARVEERAAAMRSLAATLTAGRTADDQRDRLTRRAKRR